MSTLIRARQRRGLALSTCAGALALGLAACGGGGATDPNPAEAVPASTPIYAEVVVRPDGDLKSDTEAALKKLGIDDPAAEIDKLLKQSTENDENVDEIKGFIGSRVGIFFTSLSGQEAEGALVMAVTDSDKAVETLDKDAKKKGSYKDVDYWTDKDGDVSGVVNDFAVSGTERAFRTVVDTVKGDDVETMADNASYEEGLDAIGDDDALATVYVSTEGVLNAIGRSGGIPAEQLGQIRQQLTKAGGTASVAKLTGNGEAIAIETATLGVKESATSAGGDATAALQALPGDSWLGLGFASIGANLAKAKEQALQAASVTGQDVGAQIDAAEAALGIDIEADLLSWMGDGALFARGTSISAIGGALVVQTTDPAKTKQALAKIEQLVPQLSSTTTTRALTGVNGADEGIEFGDPSLPFPLIAAVGGDKFVVGVGKPSVEAALSPAATLGDSASFKSATQALDGIKPAFFLDMAAITSFLKAFVPTDDPDTAEAFSYLEKFTTVAAGTARDGSTQRARIVLTLK